MADPSLRDTDPQPMSMRNKTLLETIAGPRGRVKDLGPRHMSVFRRGNSTLLVAFDTLQAVRGRSGGAVLGATAVRAQGWSFLNVIADGRTWFRDDAVHDLFDKLTDDGVFDHYERVIFAGAGMAAYGAGAHSVAAPGATVVLIKPYATLDRAVAPWERRFRAGWSLPFGPRYGNAAQMVDGAERVYLVTDPHVAADAMHASLFSGRHVVRLIATNAGQDVLARVEGAGLVEPLLAEAGAGILTPKRFARMWRARHGDRDWLKGLLRRTERRERPYLSALVAGRLVQDGAGRPARRRLDAALAQLDDLPALQVRAPVAAAAKPARPMTEPVLPFLARA